MNLTTIRRTTALAVLVLLLAGVPWLGMFVKRTGGWKTQEWVLAFCLTQSVLLAACSVYGPGKLIARIPVVIAWGLALGFALATLNLISSQGRPSLAAGAILVATGTLGPLIVFTLHRWRTGGYFAFGSDSPRGNSSPSVHQLSLRMLMILTAAFALAGTVARSAITAPPDPFGTEHDILVIQAWIGFFPCLATAPLLLNVFRPSWKIALAVVFFVVVTCADLFLLGVAGPYIFHSKNFFQTTSWNDFAKDVMDSVLWHGEAAIAVVNYAILARAAGLRMVGPSQSSDKNPNPSAQPATEAGCVQD